MKIKAFKPFTKKNAFIMSLLIGTILNVILLLGFIYYSKDKRNVDSLRFIYMFVTNIIVLYLLYWIVFYAIQKKWKKQTKFWFTLGGSIAIVIPLSLIFTVLLEFLFPDIRISVSQYFIINLTKDLIMVIIVEISTLLLFTTMERQQTLLENERLISDNIRIRYEVLKNQVDPHFLFNSLNTLDGLIGIDDNRAHDYLQNLSQVFRYAIGNKDIVRLSEELDFTESYAHLMKIRYGENIQIQYNIAENYKEWYVMPISLQLLVENSIKHNVISTKFPLVILIETTPRDTITVSNVIQAKNDPENGEGIGLANLTGRYNLLFQKEISITITDSFCVEIPLIKHLNTAII